MQRRRSSGGREPVKEGQGSRLSNSLNAMFACGRMTYLFFRYGSAFRLLSG